MGIHVYVRTPVHIRVPASSGFTVGRVFLFLVPVFSLAALVPSGVGVGSFPVPMSPARLQPQQPRFGAKLRLGIRAENITFWQVLKWVTVKGLLFYGSPQGPGR